MIVIRCRSLLFFRRLCHSSLQHPVSPRPIDCESCTNYIKNCSTIKSLKCVHASILKANLHLNLFFCTTLISQYASLGSVSYAYSLFSLLQSLDVFLWNVMLRGFVDAGFYRKAMLLYAQMLDLGIRPDNFTFPFVFKACGFVQDLDFGVRVHYDAVNFGYELDVFVANSLIAMYGRCGRSELAREVFDKMPERNVVSWSSIIGAYAQNGQYSLGVSLFSLMLIEGFQLNRSVLLNVMACVHSEKEADDVFRMAMDHELGLNQSVQNAAVGMYARCGRIDTAEEIFNGIHNKDLVSWASMIEAYVQADLPLKAMEIFREMILKGLLPDSITLLGVIRACLALGSFSQACFVHGFVIRRFFGNQVVVETAIVDLYVKCGSLIYARKVFDNMKERNVISWSTMISGYGLHGHGRKAICLFNEMKNTTKPDHITFVSILAACSHAGLVAEGWDCFNAMSRDFELKPGSEHYACMVDLLGRVGKLKEAREFISKMPIRPNAGVWGALLGACRIHSNVEMAEVAATNLLELDPENPGRYVLLYNIYLSSGKRKEADQIRALMKQRGLRKIAGHTIIQMKNKVHTFVAGDRSHPQTEMIYSELDKVIYRIQEEGYTPDLNFVLHDVEEETKEKLLYVHSEKLAIVFGLLNSGSGSLIRLQKNLRVCGDCHTFTKFVSKVARREIIVRDARRFHQFKDGTCSCGDYW
ncbi:pentatricopeptide repeat-containing protein At3g26782, mitochondrial-like isoform X1 [Cucurbita moschata]|uniref:Pentatricopeptide repeat-containing protein At3g26782, mitochondrial-like isoform X1 n=1 Tax=Cucurbita moschata TaxID=3662 RepID=A0A6J1EC65_CUCMO|nr:pentatricopeptide repeat-containing protein At3g26782, mitochondrial-like isoform X1 [Cucurbita moschata]